MLTRWLRCADIPKPLPRAGSDEERAALLAALARHGENVTLTAQELGVSRVTLYRMLRRHSVSLDRGLREPPITRSSGPQPTYKIDAAVG
jgi:DNA-binding NtrC family response regulator